MSFPQTPVVERAISRLVTDLSTGCWLWTGSTNSTGYGQIEDRSDPSLRKGYVVHRLMWEALRGPIPEGYDLHHRCHVRVCANPDHLVPMDHVAHSLEHHPRLDDCRRCGSNDWYVKPVDGRRRCRECRRRARRAEAKG